MLPETPDSGVRHKPRFASFFRMEKRSPRNFRHKTSKAGVSAKRSQADSVRTISGMLLKTGLCVGLEVDARSRVCAMKRARWLPRTTHRAEIAQHKPKALSWIEHELSKGALARCYGVCIPFLMLRAAFFYSIKLSKTCEYRSHVSFITLCNC